MNASWLITLALFTFLLGDQVYPDVLSGQPMWFYWTLAVVSGVFFFASIVIHELAHSLIAKRSGIPVRAITLFMLGGVSQITREAGRPLVEFVMAIVGPLTSIVLAGLFLGLAYT
ncbi:MAG: site-2 protease family protein, partial [Gemmatimonadaceae bacterium]